MCVNVCECVYQVYYALRFQQTSPGDTDFLLQSDDKALDASFLLCNIAYYCQHWFSSLEIGIMWQYLDKRPNQTAFFILGTHVISTRHSQHSPPPLQSSVDRHRESLLPEKQRSVDCVVTFPTHRINLERGKKRAAKQTSFVFTKTRCRLLLRSRLWCHRHGSSSLWPLGWWFFDSFIGRCAPIRALVLFHCDTHTPAPFA